MNLKKRKIKCLKNIEKLHAFGLKDESSSSVFILRVVILLRWVCHGVSSATPTKRELRRINFPLFDGKSVLCVLNY